MPRVKCKNATSITRLQIICSHKLTTPGVEPVLSRPRRDVLTTRRCGRLNASRQRSSTHTTIYRNSTGSAHVPRWPMSRLKAHSIHLARIERQVTTHRGKLKNIAASFNCGTAHTGRLLAIKCYLNQMWTHWDLNPGPSACEADVIPLHHEPV